MAEQSNRGKTTTKLQKLSLSTPGKLELVPDKRLPGAFLVIVADGSHCESYTIHHPIGVTDQQPGDWVKSRTADIHSLLARAKDPSQDVINQLRGAERTRQLIKGKHLVEHEGEIYYPEPIDAMVEHQPRRLYLDSVRKAHKAKVAQERAEYLGTIQAKEGSKNWNRAAAKFRSSTRVEAFYLAEVLSAENAMKAYCSKPEVRDAIERAAPQTYRTRGGPTATRTQHAWIKAEQAPTREVAVDLVNRRIHALGKKSRRGGDDDGDSQIDETPSVRNAAAE